MQETECSLWQTLVAFFVRSPTKSPTCMSKAPNCYRFYNVGLLLFTRSSKDVRQSGLIGFKTTEKGVVIGPVSQFLKTWRSFPRFWAVASTASLADAAVELDRKIFSSHTNTSSTNCSHFTLTSLPNFQHSNKYQNCVITAVQQYHNHNKLFPFGEAAKREYDDENVHTCWWVQGLMCRQHLRDLKAS